MDHLYAFTCTLLVVDGNSPVADRSIEEAFDLARALAKLLIERPCGLAVSSMESLLLPWVRPHVSTDRSNRSFCRPEQP
jgi:hypothetical protein